MSKDLQKSNKTTLKNSAKGKLDLTTFNMQKFAQVMAVTELPRLYYQLVVFVLDASESMTWMGVSGKSKGEEVHNQIIPIIERLRNSKNENSFDISMYAFSQGHKEFLPSTSPKKIDLNGLSFNPCDHVGNYQTYAEPVFLEVESKIEKYLDKYKNKNTQAMIVFLGDGDIYDYPEVIEICERIKKNKKTTILSYLLEDKKWKENLSDYELNTLKTNIKNMSSKDSNGLSFFDSQVDPEEIRKHMIKSISSVSKID